MVGISIILPTAREAYGVMLGLPEKHILQPCVESLKKQTFTDFEFIVVDALYDHRPKMFNGEPFKTEQLNFTVKHIPLHPNHRFWLNRKRACASAAMNTGIIHSEGELIVKLDDCCEFKEDYLHRIWEAYLSGYFPLSIYTKFHAGKQAYYTKEFRNIERKYLAKRDVTELETLDEKMKLRLEDLGDGGPVRDSRWRITEQRGKMIAPKNWFYGYSSFALEAALKVNGFDELFDGDTQLMDVDMGIRLNMAGYKNMLLDKDIWVVEHEHDCVSPHVIKPESGNIKCNYPIMLLNERKGRWRANSDKLTEKDLEFIVQETLRPPCQWNPHQYLDDCHGEVFKLWVLNQPIFDLREERLNV